MAPEVLDNTKEVRIVNLEDLERFTHHCESTETLTAIQVSIGKMEVAAANQAGTLHTLNQKFDALSRQVHQILVSGHTCTKSAEVKKLTDQVEYLIKTQNKQAGAWSVIAKAWGIPQSILVAVIIAVILYFLKL